MPEQKILQNGRMLLALEAELARRCDLHPRWKEADPAAFLSARGGGFASLATTARVGASAGLDVYTDEPNLPERVFALENSTLLPQVASAAHEARQAITDLVLEHLQTYLVTGKVRTGVPLPA